LKDKWTVLVFLQRGSGVPIFLPNQNILMVIPSKKFKEWPPAFPHEHSKVVEDWLISNKTFKISRVAQ